MMRHWIALILSVTFLAGVVVGANLDQDDPGCLTDAECEQAEGGQP